MVDLVPTGAAAKTGLVEVGDQLIATSAGARSFACIAAYERALLWFLCFSSTFAYRVLSVRLL